MIVVEQRIDISQGQVKQVLKKGIGWEKVWILLECYREKDDISKRWREREKTGWLPGCRKNTMKI
jgi:hypothetical protein